MFLQSQIQESYDNARMVLKTIRNRSTLTTEHLQEASAAIAEQSFLALFHELAMKL
jgi:hypothetical protein